MNEVILKRNGFVDHNETRVESGILSFLSSQIKLWRESFEIPRAGFLIMLPSIGITVSFGIAFLPMGAESPKEMFSKQSTITLAVLHLLKRIFPRPPPLCLALAGHGLRKTQAALMHGKKPLLTLDVWEHAYYIDYRNARPKFIEGWWDVVNWDFVAKNLASEKTAVVA